MIGLAYEPRQVKENVVETFPALLSVHNCVLTAIPRKMVLRTDLRRLTTDFADYTLPFVIYTDACALNIGAVLMQQDARAKHRAVA